MTSGASTAAGRVLRVLETLARAPEGRTAHELVQELGLPRSTVYALLRVLRRMGYVEQLRPRGPYRLGMRILWLAAAVNARALVIAFQELA